MKNQRILSMVCMINPWNRSFWYWSEIYMPSFLIGCKRCKTPQHWSSRHWRRRRRWSFYSSVEIRPENEYDRLVRLSDEYFQDSNMISSESRPCGGFSLRYECACDFYQLQCNRVVQNVSEPRTIEKITSSISCMCRFSSSMRCLLIERRESSLFENSNLWHRKTGCRSSLHSATTTGLPNWPLKISNWYVKRVDWYLWSLFFSRLQRMPTNYAM